jgi:alpha-L-fucosidase 2
VGRESRLLEGFERAVQKRQLKAQSGWSLAHMSCVYSRLGLAEQAIRCMDTLAKGCLLSNLYTLHNDWRSMGASMDLGAFAPVQLDASMGIVNAVQEMLICVSRDALAFLPACPPRLRHGSVRGLRFQQGQVSFDWDLDASVLNVELRADRDCRLHLVPPQSGGKGEEVSLASGEVYNTRMDIPQSAGVQTRSADAPQPG